MKKLIPAALIAIGLIFIASKLFAQSPAVFVQAHYEYASIRHMGGEKTTVHWPDGKISKLYDLTDVKRPKDSDERLWCLNMMINLLAKQGYEPIDMPTVTRDPNDVWLRRRCQ